MAPHFASLCLPLVISPIKNYLESQRLPPGLRLELTRRQADFKQSKSTALAELANRLLPKLLLVSLSQSLTARSLLIVN